MTTPNAATIIAAAAATAAKYNNQYDRLACNVGYLEASVRRLCDQIADMQADAQADAQPEPTVTELADMAGLDDADRRYAESKDAPRDFA